MLGKIVLLLALLCCAHYLALAKTSNVICYFTNWTTYRSGNGQFKVADVDANLCTHIFYAFGGVSTDGQFIIRDQWADIGLHQIRDIIALKEKNKDLKVLLSIGGYRQGSNNFTYVAGNSTARANFISSALAAIKLYGFDGLDLVWEFPISIDKGNYARLIQEFRTTFTANNMLLTAIAPSIGDTVDKGYDVQVLSKNLDMITLLEYDFHSFFDKYTGSNAPLYYSPNDKSTDAKILNINASVNYWLSLGADPQKLIIGVPLYGKSYALDDKSQNGLSAPASGPGPNGPYTKQDGVLGYNEVCELIKEGGWTRVWEDYQKVPYMYKNELWVSYDDETSMKAKVAYAKQMNLLGVSAWALGTDDFHGVCGKANGLLSAINDEMRS